MGVRAAYGVSARRCALRLETEAWRNPTNVLPAVSIPSHEGFAVTGAAPMSAVGPDGRRGTETALRPLSSVQTSMATAKSKFVSGALAAAQHFFSQVPHPPRARRSSRRARWRPSPARARRRCPRSPGAQSPARRGTSSSSPPTSASMHRFSAGRRPVLHPEHQGDSQEDGPERDLLLARPRGECGRLSLPVVGASAAAQGLDARACLAGAGTRGGRLASDQPARSSVVSSAARLQVSRDDRERPAARLRGRRSAKRRDLRNGVRAARTPSSAGHVLLGRDPDGRAGSPRRPVARAVLHLDLADLHHAVCPT